MSGRTRARDLRSLFPYLEIDDKAAQTCARPSQAYPDKRPIVAQSGSRLLSLPTELRFLIASYMSISPKDGIDSLGVYYACRQLQKDLWDQLQPARDLSTFVKDNHESLSEPSTRVSNIKIGPLDPMLRLITSMTVTLPVPEFRHRLDWGVAFTALYPLYLNELKVVLTGSLTGTADLPNGDMKSWPSRYFIDYVVDGKVNCKKVVFMLDELADQEDGRHKTTRIANIILGTKILCVMDITQNKIGAQTERAYSSDVRFRSLKALND
jgi:hypothetical protein